MTTKSNLLEMQLEWAGRAGKVADKKGYLPSTAENLFQPLSPLTATAFAEGSGSETRDTPERSAKMRALHSSAALAVNVFDYWTSQDAGALLLALGLDAKPVSIQFEAKFPTGLEGNPPNLDVAFLFGGAAVVAVESKFSEWLTPKAPGKELFKPKYFSSTDGIWAAQGLKACQELASQLQTRTVSFRHLDVAQLLKHALGLGKQHPGHFELYYIFFDCPGPESIIHRAEVEEFARRVGGDFTFRWVSYQDMFKVLTREAGPEHSAYMAYLRERYFSEVLPVA